MGASGPTQANGETRHHRRQAGILGVERQGAQRLSSNGDFHGMCCIVRALAGKTQNGVASPVYKQDGNLTRGDEERELRRQEHFAGVFGRQVRDLNRVREEHESFAAVTYGSEISHHEAVSDPVLSQLMAPPAAEGGVTTLQKRKGVGPDGVSSETLQAGGIAVAVKLAEIHERVILEASWPLSWAGDGYTTFTSTKRIQLSVTTHVGYS